MKKISTFISLIGIIACGSTIATPAAHCPEMAYYTDKHIGEFLPFEMAQLFLPKEQGRGDTTWQVHCIYETKRGRVHLIQVNETNPASWKQLVNGPTSSNYKLAAYPPEAWEWTGTWERTCKKKSADKCELYFEKNKV